ncbi:hypothetical protein DBR18_18040 [Pseudomonas sp. HMWF021]|jgi:hypothetical protein|nr:hypothetical protein DBR18_18040 [Pseudomonas sp. HMWF021]
MPQNCQIIGVNSVTNIELGKGVMPAPIIRNADWLETLPCLHHCPRPDAHLLMSEDLRTCMLCGVLSLLPICVQDSGKLPIY